MQDDVNGDEAMKNLDDLTDKLFKVKRDDVAEITEDETDNATQPEEDE